VSSLIDDVEEFYRKVLNHHAPVEVRDLTPVETAYRLEFLKEELNEYQDALLAQDRAEQLDALVDLVFVAIGTARLFQGFDFEEAWRRVHAANLKKVGGGVSKRGHALDTGKPPGWQAPDLTDLVASPSKPASAQLRLFHLPWCPVTEHPDGSDLCLCGSMEDE